MCEAATGRPSKRMAGENPLESFNLPPDGEILSKASATRGATCQDEAKAPRSPFSKPREGGGSSSSLAVQLDGMYRGRSPTRGT